MSRLLAWTLGTPDSTGFSDDLMMLREALQPSPTTEHRFSGNPGPGHGILFGSQLACLSCLEERHCGRAAGSWVPRHYQKWEWDGVGIMVKGFLCLYMRWHLNAGVRWSDVMRITSRGRAGAWGQHSMRKQSIMVLGLCMKGSSSTSFGSFYSLRHSFADFCRQAED